MEENKAGFEERLQRVQAMISDIEEGKLTLEDSVRRYEEGMKELNGLDAELKDLTRRLTILQSGPEGEREQPLEAAP
ncbi:MAG: exodeoxyribonuclease VII small subunit [Clostridia bacterium]|nr:exodeoxyribonuclease VII small subunit [Clostridia bacterium]